MTTKNNIKKMTFGEKTNVTISLGLFIVAIAAVWNLAEYKSQKDNNDVAHTEALQRLTASIIELETRVDEHSHAQWEPWSYHMQKEWVKRESERTGEPMSSVSDVRDDLAN